ncbi:NeuD/PglB/VioB family sugar acetyltransferase [Acidovorax sp. A1169]|uniref:NeuD/PglB/VioB family sugar acetyltransferase n=1 Tax=Acidovorax sp. A1169 TaxID=3059524 RepID=UPI002737CCEF|nr:NeuD/PglB/VioB family sugar acetyltransferase [Acidovorax sp. A1169]MDP4075702.1 NeuD/PglB/VioB family sugar acetyltransferase [Acidovorax sp. A1169]
MKTARARQQLVIIGAGGFGRTVASLARSDVACGVDWDVKGFLDNRTGLATPSDLPILGDPMTYQVASQDLLLCALGDPAAKRHYTEPLCAQGGNFISLQTEMHIGERCHISRGCIFERKVSLGTDVHIGEFVTILSTSIIGYDVCVGDYCQIGSFVFIGGGAQIGNDVVIHPHATILPGIKIGDGAVVGAGSVVIRHVPPRTTVMGNPAKPFNFR